MFFRHTSMITTFALSISLPAGAQNLQGRMTSEGSSASLNTACSYTKTIQQLSAKAQIILEQGLTEFNSDTLPHEAKDLRKQIVRLRDVLDIYSHNFSDQLQRWDNIRDGLDEGYTVVGHFKDLFDGRGELSDSDSPPKYKDEKKVKELRGKVLKWKGEYFEAAGWREKINDLFLKIQPLSSSNTFPSKKFSKFFWGGVDILPVVRNSPAQNARLLIDAQAQRVFDEHSVFLELKNLRKEKNEIVFHDHRKRIRTLVKICNIANAIVEETCNSPAKNAVESLVGRLGEIEDLIVAGRLNEEDGKDKQADKYYERAEQLFDSLKRENEQRDLLEPLSGL